MVSSYIYLHETLKLLRYKVKDVYQIISSKNAISQESFFFDVLRCRRFDKETFLKLDRAEILLTNAPCICTLMRDLKCLELKTFLKLLKDSSWNFIVTELTLLNCDTMDSTVWNHASEEKLTILQYGCTTNLDIMLIARYVRTDNIRETYIRLQLLHVSLNIETVKICLQKNFGLQVSLNTRKRKAVSEKSSGEQVGNLTHYQTPITQKKQRGTSCETFQRYR